MTKEHDDIGLSQSYRELACEKTPPKLDRAVLAMAAREGRTRYGVARAWVRPVAWAATIALSVAIVVEVTRYADPLPGPAESDSSTAAERAQRTSKSVAADSVEESVAEDFAATEMELLRGADEQARLRAGEAQSSAPPASAAPAAIVGGTTLLDEERADCCGADRRQSAETWYACIVSLRENGLDTEAKLELARLQDAFPDFREPGPE